MRKRSYQPKNTGSFRINSGWIISYYMGINDYYGNLLENGSLDEDKVNELRYKAMKNLYNGIMQN